jgi:acyl-CoA synthetase (AMP-forming)/AMP-acid ligase II
VDLYGADHVGLDGFQRRDRSVRLGISAASSERRIAPSDSHEGGDSGRFPNAGLNEFYGGTEVGLVTNLRPEDQRRKVRSVGRPVIGMFVELRDENGNVVPHDEVGEIHIGGATIIREYFNNPQATAEARKGGFFTLGDMGRFDEEGYLYIVDRKKDTIISGGENIFPNDIEDVLYKHSAVEMAAVVGAPDPKWG